MTHLFSLLIDRIKRRTLMEMEIDCLRKKIFNMKITLKGVSFLFPQYGVYQQPIASPETSLIDFSDRDFSNIRIRFDQFVLQSCIDDNDKTNNYNDDSLFQVK